jgi:Zn-dependent protease
LISFFSVHEPAPVSSTPVSSVQRHLATVEPRHGALEIGQPARGEPTAMPIGKTRPLRHASIASVKLRLGWLHVGTFHGAPVRMHWTLPIGAFVLTGMGWAPGGWLGFVLVVLAHELGHALLVRFYKLRVVGIDVHGMGGECQWSGAASERQRAVIAWGGVLAQLVLLFTTPLWGSRLPQPPHPFFEQLISAFTATNTMIMLVNLIPVAPLDGAMAWRVFRLGDLIPSRNTVALRMRARKIKRELDALAREREQDDAEPRSGPRETDRSKLN